MIRDCFTSVCFVEESIFWLRDHLKVKEKDLLQLSSAGFEAWEKLLNLQDWRQRPPLMWRKAELFFVLLILWLKQTAIDDA